MPPLHLALVDDDAEYTEFLAQYLRDRGLAVDVFADSHDLMALEDPYGYDFYVVDLMLPGIDGVNLIKLLRRRTNAGVLVVSGRLAAEVFREVVTAGADMYLVKPVQFEQVEIAIEAVQRRAAAPGATPDTSWTLDRRARQLVAPDGVRVELSEADRALLECFIEANGEVVTRETLRRGLGKAGDDESGDGLNATIYRLRRRIEKATPSVVPLQARSRVGYVFRATLKVA
jgi:two-component system OmpR family response regulator